MTCMQRLTRAASLALATFAVMLAAAATTLGAPGDLGGCASGCSVGSHGTGGENSGGAAQGFNDKNLSFEQHPGEIVSNSGTDFSGHLVAEEQATGATIVSISGGLARGTGEFVGHVAFDGGACSGVLSHC